MENSGIPFEKLQIQKILKCNLYTTFGIILQFSLLFFVVIAMVLKNHFDKNKREWLIWFLDMSKQGLSAVSIHLVNLILSTIMGYTIADPCKWYFVNLFLDSTIGVFFSCFFLNYLKNEFQHKYPSYFQTGFYGGHYFVNWCKQTSFWVFVVGISKFITFFVLFYFRYPMQFFVDFVFGFMSSENEELIFVMIIFPLIFNIFAVLFADASLKGTIPYNYKSLHNFRYSVLENSLD
jgi:hypothetical protein